MLIKRIFISFLLGLCSLYSNAQEVEIIKKPQLDALLSPSLSNDTVYVINFWATWCKPCVKELPYFEKLNKESGDLKLKVILVSLDFKKNLESQLKTFLRKNNIQSTVLLLDEPDYNSWINEVSIDWSGAIPATILIKGSSGRKSFHEREFNYDELMSEVKKIK